MSKIKKYYSVIIAVALAASLPPTPSEAKQDSTGGIEHQRVLWMENPAEEAVISWTTRSPGETHKVYYDTVSRDGVPGDYAYSENSFKDGKFTMIDEDIKWTEPGYYHHVYLDNLKPDTQYYFVIASDEDISREYHFITAPDRDESFAILFGGDSRIRGRDPYDHTDRQKMNLRMRTLFEANPHILALVHGGDYCQRAEWRYLDPWLSDHELVITEEGRMLPIIPARGNHDIQIGFEEKFSWPNYEGDYYYTTRLSPEVALVTLNTEISLGGNQRKWLRNELASLRPDNRWLFVQYHRPSHPSVRSMQDGASRRKNWVPAFEQYNVDLVCESHDHALKRTAPLRNGKIDKQNGIIYIGDGGLGVPQRSPDPTRWWFGDHGFTKSVHHVHLIEFSDDTMRVRAFGMDGELLDDFYLYPRDSGLQPQINRPVAVVTE